MQEYARMDTSFVFLVTNETQSLDLMRLLYDFFSDQPLRKLYRTLKERTFAFPSVVLDPRQERVNGVRVVERSAFQ